ncbi:MAG: DUF4912 domain-containing protein [Sulfuricaulis sp.]|uniref:DUF4912 domain-containing protein n=1 Tax=Sulfuricaulis sp. TaxID=2003553 RepID=UPI003C487A5D
MTTKTLTELRAQARARGLKGYSKMSRGELERLLTGSDSPKPAAAKKPEKTPSAKKASATKSKAARAPAKPAFARGKKKPAATRAPTTTPAAAPSAPLPRWEWADDIARQSTEEERVESAKYATAPPGSAAAPAVTAADLGEDIDNLPPVTEATLCLLPQKPGVLHGYWVIPPNTMPNSRSLKLRLGRIVRDAFEIVEEISLPHERGHWYFHLDESADTGAIYLQLGYYEADGSFVTATRRGIARIPSLHASERTDRLWWVSEKQFRAMYRRAGGIVRGGRLGWAASISSPGGAPPAPSSERLAWPGNISSPHK